MWSDANACLWLVINKASQLLYTAIVWTEDGCAIRSWLPLKCLVQLKLQYIGINKMFLYHSAIYFLRA